MAANSLSFDDMHDIVVSEPVSWWPLAPGWFVILLALALSIVWLGAKAFRQWRKNAYRREALRALALIEPAELPELVKRVCLSAWPREQVATLSGDALLQFLNQSGNTTDFSQASGALLLELSYNPNLKTHNGDVEYQRLFKMVSQWIRHHK